MPRKLLLERIAIEPLCHILPKRHFSDQGSQSDSARMQGREGGMGTYGLFCGDIDKYDPNVEGLQLPHALQHNTL